MTTIRDVLVRHFKVPLAQALVDAKHGKHDHFDLVTATVRLSDGSEGTGYTYTGGRGGQAIAALIEHDLAPFLVGRDGAAVEDCHDAMLAHIHYVGRGGIASFAVSALDIALWDARGRREGRSLVEMAGSAGKDCRAYQGGIDLAFTETELVGSVRRGIERGFDAVKIKVGKPSLAEDASRVAAVRSEIGNECALMVDANYAMGMDEAIVAAKAFAQYDIVWFEEPIVPDDFEGYAKIADATGVPIAMGENLHTIYEFERAIGTSKLAYLQPDASNCGGVTGWLRVARKAREAGITVCSHGMHELHVSLVTGFGGDGWLEVHSFPIDTYTERPLEIRECRALAPAEPGTGVSFDWERLEREVGRSAQRAH